MSRCEGGPGAVGRRALLHALAAGAAGWLGFPVQAAPRVVEPFDAATWQRFKDDARLRGRPRLVVFSATWCAVCPGVVERLAQEPRRRRAGADLVVVMIDVAPGEADASLLGAGHHALADRLLAFDGPAPALRRAVDPGWRGVVPHVAWLAPGQPPRFSQGMPREEVLAAWF